jgi:antitoxin YefM
MTTTPLGDAKNRFSELVDRAHRTHERFEITVHGATRAVLMSADDLESLEETLAILSDPEAMANLREAEQEMERGEYSTSDEIKALLDARLAK